jgi:chromosome segregation ATPase
MARGVTQEQVTHAADALLARGERPTIEKVRAELGTGSPNTLLRLLEVWWSELAGRLAAQARAQLPEIPDAVKRAMMTLWSEAVVATRQEAENRYAERARGLVEQEAALQAQLEQITTQQHAQQQTLNQAVHEYEVAREDLANERRRTEELQKSLSAALHSLTEAQTTIAGLRRSGEEAQKMLRVDRERADAAEQRWLREVDRAREDAKAAKHDASTTRAKLAGETKHRMKLEEELALLKRQAKDLERQRKQVRGKRSSAREPLSTGRTKVRAARLSTSRGPH